MKVNKLLGIIGGLGPMSSAYFYELLTSHTKVSCDQDNIDLLLSSKSSTPDRTDFIMGKSENSPLPFMINEAQMLERNGADVIIMICNTAHYFIDEIRKSIGVPMPSIIEETVNYLAACNKKKVAILATDGTLYSATYQTKLTEAGIDWVLPQESEQKLIMSIIYDYVKRGITPPQEMVKTVYDALMARDCDAIIAGCTELPLAFRNTIGSDNIIDPMEVLAYKVIKIFDRTPTGFPESFSLIK